MPDPDFRLYFVLNVTGLPGERDPLWLAAEAARGGAGAVQLRGKTLGGRDLHDLSWALRGVLAPLGVPLFIDDRLDVALSAGAQGVHLGAGDVPFGEARRVAPNLRLGVSCYGSLEVARRAAEAGADYLAFGAMHPTPTKPEAAVVSTAVLREARVLGLPVLAIGGVTVDNAAALIAAGADGVAVVSAIQDAPDPRAAASALRGQVVRRAAEDSSPAR